MSTTSQGMRTKRSFSSVKRQELFHVDVEQLTHHRTDRDPKLPLVNGTIDYHRIAGSELIKFAARYAETLEKTNRNYLGVCYTHRSAAHACNGYAATMVILNGTRVTIPPKHILVGQNSIVVNGFVALRNGMQLIKE